MDIQKRLLPDLLPVMQRRFDILQYISLMEPVGRRSLSVSLGITERILRAEVTLLKEQNLIRITSVGMSLTAEGQKVLEGLTSTMRELKGLNSLELQVQKSLKIEKVIMFKTKPIPFVQKWLKERRPSIEFFTYLTK